MRIEFSKMHGLGNDYIYIDCINEPNRFSEQQIPEIARKLSDRHFAVGGDGIVLILPHAEADFQMRMFNADGSEAEMCGNAIRCVGKFVYDKGYTDQEVIKVQTGAGILTLHMTVEAGAVEAVRVDMGEPILDGLTIPTTIDQPVVKGEVATLADGSTFAFTAVSMGNPHCVIFVDEVTDQLVWTEGKELESHALFPRRINVEFCRVIDRETVEMRVYERGSGETMACGTGASATAVAAVLNGLTDRQVTVKLLGGDLLIEWNEADNHVYMTGPATFAFEGSVEV